MLFLAEDLVGLDEDPQLDMPLTHRSQAPAAEVDGFVDKAIDAMMANNSEANSSTNDT